MKKKLKLKLKKNYNKNNVFYQDRQTDRRSTQNYSSEPHKSGLTVKNTCHITKMVKFVISVVKIKKNKKNFCITFWNE